MRFGIHATVRLDRDVLAWVEDQAQEHVDWCKQFGIEVEFHDAVSDVVDTEIEGFASRDWIKFSLACHLLGCHDFTANFTDRSTASTEGGRVVEVVLRPSLWKWLVQQAGGDDLSDVVNDLLARARLVDWSKYGEVEELVGEPDCFVLEGGPPENAIELCERLVEALDESEEIDGQASTTELEDRINQ